MDVYVDGKRIALDPKNMIGKGGEADVYAFGTDKVLKIFKQPSHPDFEGMPHEQKGAEERIAEHQTKLRAFPKGLPSRVIAPINIATDRSGKKILGYSMPFLSGMEVLLKFSDKDWRTSNHVGNDAVIDIFRDMHSTVSGVHKANVVIGDYNDLNVLVKGKEAYFIDADSMQFDPYYCRVFTARFVDPLLCNNELMLKHPHTSASDWYAYTVMFMQCLLYVDPYGGIYKPKDPAKRIPHNKRPLHRITVFNPEVKYPKPAIPYAVLPDELLHLFEQVFVKDLRAEFPAKIIQNLCWTTCTVCGTEHARTRCPNCAHVAPAAVKEAVVIRGTVTATRKFRTVGMIVHAAVSARSLSWIYHENGAYRREDGSVIILGDIDPNVRFRCTADVILIGKNGQLIVMKTDGTTSRYNIDNYGQSPMFNTNALNYFWVQSGQLMRNGNLGPDYIGDVLQGQSVFWVGPRFGFGFYRAGGVNVSFVFNADHGRLNDSIRVPRIVGQLIDATCVFSESRCWFFTATQDKGKILHRSVVMKSDGSVDGILEVEKGDSSWLGSSMRGSAAAGNFLLVPTDEGIVRVEVQNGALTITREFPDTEPFVNASSQLYAGPEGVYVLSRKEVVLLTIK